MTPHITAKKDEISKIVLMPGDPLRAKYIAETFLKDAKLVNTVRNVFFYTGTYEGHRVTIAASGMGCASIGIYSYELFKFYDVDYIIRIGSAGSYDAKLKLYDIVNATEAVGENDFAKIVIGKDTRVLPAPGNLRNMIADSARTLGKKLVEGPVHSSDVFYRKNPDDWKTINKQTGSLCVEMESFALFANAIATNKSAACLLTISDSLVTHETTTAEERQNNFVDMMKIALHVATKV